MDEEPNSSQVPETFVPKVKIKNIKSRPCSQKSDKDWIRTKALWGNKSVKDLLDGKGYQKSSVSHLSYDFTCFPPKRISPIIEEEVDSLAEQLGEMDSSQDRKRDLKRQRLHRLRALRDMCRDDPVNQFASVDGEKKYDDVTK